MLLGKLLIRCLMEVYSESSKVSQMSALIGFEPQEASKLKIKVQPENPVEVKKSPADFDVINHFILVLSDIQFLESPPIAILGRHH